MLRLLSICLVVSVLTVGVAQGQVNNGAAMPGSWMVSGSASMAYNLPSSGETDSEDGSISISLYPRVLYFPFMPGLGLGIDGNLGWYSNAYKTTSIGIGPRAAYYFRLDNRRYPAACCLTPFVGPDGWWLPYVGASFLYLMESTKYGEYDPTTSNGWRFRVGLGVSPLIGTRGTMPVELGFQTGSLTTGSGEHQYTSKSSKIYLEVGFGAFLWKQE